MRDALSLFRVLPRHLRNAEYEGGGGAGSDDAPPRPRDTDLRTEAAQHRIEARSLREENESLRRQLQDAAGVAARRVEEEVRKVSARLSRAQAKYLDAELKAAAAAAGLHDLDLLPLIDRSGVQIDEEFNLSGVEEAIRTMREKKPDWFRQGAAAAGSADAGRKPPTRTGNPHTPPATPPKPKRVQDMTPQEYREHKRGIQRRLRGKE